MNFAHLHLLMNHVPVIGMVLTLPLLAWGVWKRSNDLTRASLWLLAAMGAASVIVYFTGEPAEEVVEGLVGVSGSLIESHEEAALIAAILLVFTGIAASVTLFRFRLTQVPRTVGSILLLLAAFSSAVVGYTANLGGRIRHTEITGAGVSVEQQHLATQSAAGQSSP